MIKYYEKPVAKLEAWLLTTPRALQNNELHESDKFAQNVKLASRSQNWKPIDTASSFVN